MRNIYDKSKQLDEERPLLSSKKVKISPPDFAAGKQLEGILKKQGESSIKCNKQINKVKFNDICQEVFILENHHHSKDKIIPDTRCKDQIIDDYILDIEYLVKYIHEDLNKLKGYIDINKDRNILNHLNIIQEETNSLNENFQHILEIHKKTFRICKCLTIKKLRKQIEIAMLLSEGLDRFKKKYLMKQQVSSNSDILSQASQSSPQAARYNPASQRPY